MLQNYLRIAWRNLIRQKGFSLINILGLAIGMAACLLILQYVRYELSFDTFYPEANQVFRVATANMNDEGATTETAATFLGVGPLLEERLPEVEAFTRLTVPFGGEASVLSPFYKGKEKRAYYTDSSFFKVFQRRLIQGNPSTILKVPYACVISKSLAKKYFGDRNPVGQTLTVLDDFQRDQFVIEGVMEDVPEHTHLKVDMLLSLSSFEKSKFASDYLSRAWGDPDFHTYIRAAGIADPDNMALKIQNLVAAEVPNFDPQKCWFDLQPITDIHLYSHLERELETNGSPEQVYFFLVLALGILFMAWINYINLATARSIRRAHEVGVRKVVGAIRGQLIRQFLLEALLVNAMAMLLAFVIAEVSFPAFVGFTEKALPALGLVDLMLLLGMWLGGSLLSGLYPAFVLSGFTPLMAIQGIRGTGKRSRKVWLRKGLVVLQFTASVWLIAGTFVVFQQLRYMQQQNLGFNPDQILVIDGPEVKDQTAFERLEDSLSLNRITQFKQMASEIPGVITFTSIENVPGKKLSGDGPGIARMDGPAVHMPQVVTDTDFPTVFGVELVAGRYFSPDFSTDKDAVVFNESAIQALGFASPSDAIGQQVKFGWEQKEILTIVGVVQDYHHQNLKEARAPLRYHLYVPENLPTFEYYAQYAIKISPRQVGKTISDLEEMFARLFPGNPFDYFFLDTHFAAQYEQDRRFGQLFGLFAGLAIVIACLGLLGLSTFNALQRTREVGIRKVLGASVTDITRLLAREFMILIIISGFIGLPLAWVSTREWLTQFAHRYELSWLILLVPFGLVVGIAWLTVAYQTMKAARTNPVEALRYE